MRRILLGAGHESITSSDPSGAVSISEMKKKRASVAGPPSPIPLQVLSPVAEPANKSNGCPTPLERTTRVKPDVENTLPVASIAIPPERSMPKTSSA
jgi:hypothetical protein